MTSPISNLVDASDDGSHGCIAWSINSLAVVRWTPTSAVDMNVLWFVTHRVGFYQIGHVRLVEHS